MHQYVLYTSSLCTSLMHCQVQATWQTTPLRKISMSWQYRTLFQASRQNRATLCRRFLLFQRVRTASRSRKATSRKSVLSVFSILKQEKLLRQQLAFTVFTQIVQISGQCKIATVQSVAQKQWHKSMLSDGSDCCKK